MSKVVTMTDPVTDAAAQLRSLAAEHDARLDELEAVNAELATAPSPSHRRGELLDTRWHVAAEADELYAATMLSLRCLVRCVATARRAEVERRR